MSLSNARTIGSIRKRSQTTREYRPRVRLTDHISEDVQQMIWSWHKKGCGRRQIGRMLLEMRVPSPPMKVEWGENAIRAVVEKFKALEAADGQAEEAQ